MADICDNGVIVTPDTNAIFQDEELDIDVLRLGDAAAIPTGELRTEELIDLNAQRLPQNYTLGAAVKKNSLAVTVRKSNRQEFFWVQPDEDFRIATMVYESKLDRAWRRRRGGRRTSLGCTSSTRWR